MKKRPAFHQKLDSVELVFITHHCISALERESDKHLQTYEQPEDIPYSEFEPGHSVKVIDQGEEHTEWTSFVVVTKIINPNRFSSITSYLNQPNWYFLLALLDRPTQHQFWVAETSTLIAFTNPSYLQLHWTLLSSSTFLCLFFLPLPCCIVIPPILFVISECYL